MAMKQLLNAGLSYASSPASISPVKESVRLYTVRTDVLGDFKLNPTDDATEHVEEEEMELV